MAQIENISVALPPEMTDLLNRAVASGEYTSVDEVIREALRDWKHRQDQRSIELEELRRLWREGLASGPPKPFDADRVAAIKARGRARLGSAQTGG